MASDAPRAVADDRAERRVARLAWLGTWLVRILGRTWRIRAVHDEAFHQLRAAQRPMVLSLWHGHLLTCLYHHRDEGITVLISEHGDGEIIARIAERLGYRTVRGSTSRNAARALLEVSRVIEQGSDVAFTPDGPRGPARSIAPGVAVVAQRSKAPIIGGFVRARSPWRLSTWDRFEIPKPFSRITIGYSDPLYMDGSEAREAADAVDRVAQLMATAESRSNG
jgi:lysophospholipid acyltransferase (LPLAT)-like uncharacterized protein